MSEHTPAPWHTRDTRDSGTEIHAGHFVGVVIATVYPRGSWHTAHSADQDTDPVQEANAILMSAAPDLLAALTGQRCFECHQWIEVTAGDRKPCDECADAIAAIRKALGAQL